MGNCLPGTLFEKMAQVRRRSVKIHCHTLDGKAEISVICFHILHQAAQASVPMRCCFFHLCSHTLQIFGKQNVNLTANSFRIRYRNPLHLPIDFLAVALIQNTADGYKNRSAPHLAAGDKPVLNHTQCKFHFISAFHRNSFLQCFQFQFRIHRGSIWTLRLFASR